MTFESKSQEESAMRTLTLTLLTFTLVACGLSGPATDIQVQADRLIGTINETTPMIEGTADVMGRACEFAQGRDELRALRNGCRAAGVAYAATRRAQQLTFTAVEAYRQTGIGLEHIDQAIGGLRFRINQLSDQVAGLERLAGYVQDAANDPGLGGAPAGGPRKPAAEAEGAPSPTMAGSAAGPQPKGP